MALVVLKYPTRCSECGTVLKAGDMAKFYHRSIYGIGCHTRQDTQSTDDLILLERPPRNVTDKPTNS